MREHPESPAKIPANPASVREKDGELPAMPFNRRKGCTPGLQVAEKAGERLVAGWNVSQLVLFRRLYRRLGVGPGEG